jgi:hypothetical protein
MEEYMKYLIFALLLLAACSPNSLEEYEREGQGICRRIVRELSAVHTREDLQQHSPALKEHFNALIDLMIAARKHQDDTGEDLFKRVGNIASESLRNELIRVDAIEGAREILESCQHDSLQRLDYFEQSRRKHQEASEQSR